ncbi:MAG: hypothetical protein JWR19_3570 [Pedosphaera sp.]|nr:hypothetical protein [Pedosphaera sp.]
MRIPKLLLITCVAVVGVAGSLLAQRPDSDLQTKAREQLRQRMYELDHPGSSAPASFIPVAPVVPIAPTVKVAVPVPAPAPAAPAPVMTPTPAAPAAVEATPAAPAKEMEMPAPAAAPVAVTPVPAEPNTVVITADEPVTPNAEAQAKAAEALRQKMMELNTPPKMTTPAPAAKVAPVSVHTASSATFTTPPMAGSKEQRLADLLQAYKSDQINPQEYHMQRAKILAEP